jgi:uncharacterized repeat protein (TIGR03899 family)
MFTLLQTSDNTKGADMTEKGQKVPEVSARKKALTLGHQLGLASDKGYSPGNASLAERAQQRLQIQECGYQANLETIYSLALGYTPSDVTGIELDADWRHQFFKMAEQIHNRAMQDLWARILASEIVKPGNFSLRTLSTLRQLTHREAIILEKALGLAVTVNQDPRLKLISGYRLTGGLSQYFRKTSSVNLELSQFGLPYSNLLTLMDAGILHASEFETGLLHHKTPVCFTPQGDPANNLKLKLTPSNGHLLFTYYRFTPVGDELAQLVQPKPDGAYFQMLRQLFAQDFKIDSPLG